MDSTDMRITQKRDQRLQLHEGLSQNILLGEIMFVQIDSYMYSTNGISGHVNVHHVSNLFVLPMKNITLAQAPSKRYYGFCSLNHDKISRTLYF